MFRFLTRRCLLPCCVGTSGVASRKLGRATMPPRCLAPTSTDWGRVFQARPWSVSGPPWSVGALDPRQLFNFSKACRQVPRMLRIALGLECRDLKRRGESVLKGMCAPGLWCSHYNVPDHAARTYWYCRRAQRTGHPSGRSQKRGSRKPGHKCPSHAATNRKHVPKVPGSIPSAEQNINSLVSQQSPLCISCG